MASWRNHFQATTGLGRTTKKDVQGFHAVMHDLNGRRRLVELECELEQFGRGGIVFDQQDVRRGNAHGG